jgi:predicted nucleic acid-binding protein
MEDRRRKAVSTTAIPLRCDACGDPLTFSWCCADGKNYHGHRLPFNTVDRDANIARLTAQVADLTGQRDGMLDTFKELHGIMGTPPWVSITDHARCLMSDLEVTRGERDKLTATAAALAADVTAREFQRDEWRLKHADATRQIITLERQVQRLQEQLTAAERERDEQRSGWDDCQRQAQAEIKRLLGLVNNLKAERDEHYRKLCNYWASFGGCSDSAGEQWVKKHEDRVRVLERAPRRVQVVLSAALVQSGMKKIVDDALTPAPPADGRCRHGVDLKAFYCIECDAPREDAPPAETPAPTCKCESDEHCSVHFNCDGTPKPVARDASADAPATNEPPHRDGGYWDGWYDRDQSAHDEIDRLRAELTAEKKRADENWQRHAQSSDRYGSTFKALLDTQAKLGRAVAALREYQEYRFCCSDTPSQTKLDRMVLALDDTVAAILADADSKAAGEAREATVREAKVEALELAISWARQCQSESELVTNLQCEIAQLVVDARRGQGGGR